MRHLYRLFGFLPFLAVFLSLSCNQSDESVELKFWAIGAEAEYVVKLIPEFEKRNPGIKVSVQAIPWTAAQEKLITAFAGNNTPDLCQLGNTWVPQFASLNAIEPPCAFGTGCPHDHACRRRLAPEPAIRALDLLLDRGSQRIDGARVWRAGFDSHGFMNLTSLSGHETADRTAWVRVQRHCYRQFLDRTTTIQATAPEVRLSGEASADLLRVLKDAFNLLNLLNEQGALLVRMPVPAVKAKFLTNWQRIQNILSVSPRLATLNRLWLTESEEAGGDMERIRELIRQYRELIANLMTALTPSAS